MAALTWRNVDAPDFRGAMQGYNQFSQLLSNALSSAERGLQTYDNSISDRVNTDVLAQIAQAQDVDAAKNLAETVAGRPDRNRVSAATWGAIMARPGQAIGQQAAEDELGFNQYLRGRTKDDNVARDAARAIRGQALMLSSQGKHEEAQKLLSDNAQLMGALPYDDQAKSATDILGVAAKNLDLDVGEFGLTRDKTTHGWSVEDREFGQNVDRIAGEIAARSADGLDAESLIIDRKLDGRTANAVRQRLGLQFFPSAGNFGGAGGAAGSGDGLFAGLSVGGADPLRVMNYEARAAGFAAVPDSVRTLGQASDFAKQVNRAGVASSAMGAYQIVGDTLRRYAPQVLGQDWQNAEFNFENQDKIARKIWEDHRGDPAALRKQWVSLTPQQAAQAARLPWDQARNIIMQGEVGTTLNPRQLAVEGATASAAIANEVDGDIGLRIAGLALQKFGDAGSRGQVAASLIGEGGDLEGGNRSDVIGKLKEIEQEYDVGPAIAGAILAESTDELSWSDWFSQAAGPTLGSREFGGVSIDDDRVKQLGNIFRGKGDQFLMAAADLTTQQQNVQSIAAAQQRVAAAQAALQAKRALAVRTGRPINTSVEERELAAAMIAARGSNVGGLSGAGHRPAPPLSMMSQPSGQARPNVLPSELNLYNTLLNRR